MLEFDVMFTLTDDELDAVAGGTATATLTITGFTASGPTSATTSATGVSLTASTIGGLAPSNSASVAGTFTASSS
ncbi:MAG: hypothetical protein ACJ8AI_00775 [Rhodopila sp.]|jgi:hypothetical protein